MYRRRWVILGVLCMSLMIIVIGNTSLNVAMPRMSEALGLTNSQQQWVVDAYSLIFAGMLFTAGTLGDRFGRKGFMQAGIVALRRRFGLRNLLRRLGGRGHRRPCIHGHRRSIGDAGNAEHPRQQLPVATSGPRQSASGPASPAAVAPSASCWADGSSRTSGGDRHSPSTCPSRSSRSCSAHGSCRAARTATRPSSTPSAQLLSMAGLGLFVYGLIEAPKWGWGSATSLGVIGAGIAVLDRLRALGAAQHVTDDRRAPVQGSPLRRVQHRDDARLPDDVRLLLRRQPAVPARARATARSNPVCGCCRSCRCMIIFSTRAAGLVERLGARTVVTTGMLLTAGGVFILSFLGAIVGLRPRADRNVRDGIGHGPDDDTDDRADHVVGPPRQGRCRLGDERHHPRGRHDARRRRARQHPVVGLHLEPRQRSRRSSRTPHDRRRRVRWPARSASPSEIGGTQGAAIVDAAKSAWTDGLQLSMLIGAGIVLLAAVIAARYLPGKPGGLTDEAIDLDGFDDELSGELEGFAVAAGD